MMPGQLKKITLGLSSENRPIEAWANYHALPEVPPHLTLILGGMHGDERATRLLLEMFLRNPARSSPLLVLPLVNPDGWERNSRYTATGVDLNRNFAADWSPASLEPSGPEPLSEPESQLLHRIILQQRPAKIVSLHWALAEIDADGLQSTPLARAMWQALTPEQQRPYRLRVAEDSSTENSDAFCPGSLGRWCGHQLVYADGTKPMMVTLELPYDADLTRPAILPDDHLATLQDSWIENSASYLQAAYPAVEAMLHAACKFPTA